MSFLQSLNLAADEIMSAFWHSVGVLAESESVPEADAFAQLKAAVQSRIKAVKVLHGMDYVPDGRSARWRVRMIIWPEPVDRTEPAADSDPDHASNLDYPGDTLIHGLPGVAQWAWDLIHTHHDGAEITGLSLDAIKHKIRGLRVSLSNQGGSCAWRLRYTVDTPPAVQMTVEEARARGINPLKVARGIAGRQQDYLAQVLVTREESRASDA